MEYKLVRREAGDEETLELLERQVCLKRAKLYLTARRSSTIFWNFSRKDIQVREGLVIPSGHGAGVSPTDADQLLVISPFELKEGDLTIEHYEGSRWLWPELLQTVYGDQKNILVSIMTVYDGSGDESYYPPSERWVNPMYSLEDIHRAYEILCSYIKKNR